MKPIGWKTRKLGELLDVQNGFAFDSALFSESAGMSLIRIRDLKNGSATVIRYNGAYDERFVVREGDRLIGMDGEFRCYEWRGGEALLNQRVCRLVDFSDEIDPEFVGFGINTHLKEIEEATPFVTVKHLSAKSIRGIEFSYPELPEQRRIVARIKECMERVGEVEELKSSSRVQQQCLSASLIESELHPDVTCIEGWATRTVGELVTTVRNGRSIAQDTEGLADGAVLTLTAVRGIDLGIEFQKAIALPKEVAKQFGIDAGDVFVSRANTIELVGLSAVAMDAPTERLIYPDLLIKLKVNPSMILPRYMAYALRSASSRKQIKARALGSSQTMVKISGERLREVSIPVPSLAEQERIVSRLDAAHDVMRQLATESLPGEIEVLRRAVLRKAFAGEL
ncbi:restriction endonuclease subunit S [Lysobacter sp. yr284]|uniref:restriction endonuclease subunit S n=1 Tax=Lysobacter sp. yr284 TaxID=1761791 RepID=UPI000B898788|nr:restriction endonuclease subunit S [Lysobacter sp. yr284]